MSDLGVGVRKFPNHDKGGFNFMSPFKCIDVITPLPPSRSTTASISEQQTEAVLDNHKHLVPPYVIHIKLKCLITKEN